ncbi:hypothetical protein CCHL11_07776 [Colletotrichum chlorophyti]|uniref:Uncharacterized protein n=1 Tax=Colletotrichum chlorophyti TaxID=708187 RepID=A0A1Q8RNI5_9PEZI|nr:hypothetical protein CCHL11_07776 [Colletotrichum chlorophyti]
MRTAAFNVFSVVVFALAGVMALDITDELNMGWRMGLLPRQGSQDLQTFEGDLGGAKASAITKSNDPDRPFEVDGDTFEVDADRVAYAQPDFQTAAGRACDNQKNKCAEAANNGPSKFDVSQCDEQNQKCKEAGQSSTKQTFGEPVFAGTDGNFDIFCDP